MCLEDRFLFALYNQPGFVPVTELADQIAITENALLSIVHRIGKGYPDFLLLRESPELGLQVAPNDELQKEVRLFLAGGGITEANEQELREFYALELKEYDRLQKLNSILQRYRWLRWAGGTLAFIAAGAGLRVLLKKLK